MFVYRKKHNVIALHLNIKIQSNINTMKYGTT